MLFKRVYGRKEDENSTLNHIDNISIRFKNSLFPSFFLPFFFFTAILLPLEMSSTKMNSVSPEKENAVRTGGKIPLKCGENI